jgi:hypothetical protein
MQYTDEQLIERMIDFYEDNGRWPKLRDMVAPYPGKTTYARRFASAPDMNDGFGRALTMAQIEYGNRRIKAIFKEEIDKQSMNAVYGRFGEAAKTLKDDIADVTVRPVIGWLNRRIMGFKGWMS